MTAASDATIIVFSPAVGLTAAEVAAAWNRAPARVAAQQFVALGVDWENGRIARGAGWQREGSRQAQLLYPFPF